MAFVFVLDAADFPRSGGLVGGDPFQCLNAGHLIQRKGQNPYVFKVRGLFVDLVDRDDLFVLQGITFGIEPVA